MASEIRPFLNELRGLSAFEIRPDGGRSAAFHPEDLMFAWHVETDAERIGAFLSLLRPSDWHRLRVLDLGASPYLLTFALAKLGASVVATGHPAPDSALGDGAEFVEFVRGAGEAVARAPLVRFNIEQDPFPFADGSFDAVVCGEIIEHLPYGPDHMLYESNRVLVQGGLFLLSTPNAVSLARLLSILRGSNPEWPFSPQGIYGRHNRTYSVAELEDLLKGNGLTPFLARGITYFHKREWYAPGPIGTLKWLSMLAPQAILAHQPYLLRRWAEGLLLGARKTSGPSRYRPAWLFGSADTVPMWAGGGDT